MLLGLPQGSPASIYALAHRSQLDFIHIVRPLLVPLTRTLGVKLFSSLIVVPAETLRST
jgi:hypothetical protein